MEILERLISIIEKNIGKDLELTAATRLDDDSEIDSFERLMTLNSIEDAYDFEFDTEDLQQIKTLGDVADVLKNKYKK